MGSGATEMLESAGGLPIEDGRDEPAYEANTSRELAARMNRP